MISLYRLRIKYGKLESLKFLSHLEVARAFEKAFKRAEIPLGFTCGFSPHPKISYGSVLPVGVISDCEFMDIVLTKRLMEEELLKKINLFLPDGLIVFDLKYTGLNEPSLMDSIDTAVYQVTIKIQVCAGQGFSLALFKQNIEDFLIQEDIFVSRKKNKEISSFRLKDRLINFNVLGLEGRLATLNLTVQVGNKGNLKPEEVVKAFSDFCENRLDVLETKRTALLISRDNILVDPF
jgi:radical SAM-linked protein